MKRQGNLFHKIVHPENLKEAHNSAINTIMAECSANLKIRNPMEKFTW